MESEFDAANTNEKDKVSQALPSELNGANSVDVPIVDSAAENPVRRSSKERLLARKFYYPELGNPLVSIVTSLFQGLNTAIVQSLNGMEVDDYGLNMAMPLTEPVIHQPNIYARGRAHEGRGEM